MIFQRGNPMDYERWAAEPGMKEWDYLHCLPYFKRMENCLAGADDWRGGDGPLEARARAGRRTRCSARSSQAAQEAGYPLTDDVNGYRQEGFARFDRNVYRGRRLSAARAYLHPVRRPQEPRASRRSRWRPGCGSRASARSASTTCAAAGCAARVDAGEVDPLRRRDQHPAAAPALRASATRRCCRSTASTSSTTCPASARTSRTTSRSTSSTPPSSRSRSRPACAGAPRPGDRLPVAVPPPRARRDQPLRGRRLRAQQRGRRLPEPDVPLPAGRDPVRRLGADRGPRLPGAHRPDVRRHPRLGADQVDATRSSTRRCSSTTCRPPPTAGSGSRRSGWRATSSTSPRSRRTTTASSRPGRAVETDEQILDWVRADAETALHPSCTAEDGRRRDVGRRPATDAGPRPRGPPRRRRLGLPVRHQRQHLRAR